MPQNGTVFEGRRRAGRCHTSKASGQAPAAALIQRVTLLNGDPAATARTGGRRPACTPNGASPRRVVNGYINHGHKEKSKKSPPTRGMDSPVHDASAAGGIGTAAVTPGATSENGTTRLDAVASPCHSDQWPPRATLSAPAKKQRRRQKRPLPVAPHVEEDWESDIQDVASPADWDQMSFGTMPYGPEDVLPFALRDLTLKPIDPTHLPQTDSYWPGEHHPHPVWWPSCRSRSEPDQFVDADE